jgi:hypothetical protein
MKEPGTELHILVFCVCQGRCCVKKASHRSHCFRRAKRLVREHYQSTHAPSFLLLSFSLPSHTVPRLTLSYHFLDLLPFLRKPHNTATHSFNTWASQSSTTPPAPSLAAANASPPVSAYTTTSRVPACLSSSNTASPRQPTTGAKSCPS